VQRAVDQFRQEFQDGKYQEGLAALEAKTLEVCKNMLGTTPAAQTKDPKSTAQGRTIQQGAKVTTQAWNMIARAGANPLLKPTTAQTPPPAKQAETADRLSAHKDNRLFVRLDAKSTVRKATPYQVMAQIKPHLPKGCRITRVSHIPTGIALVPAAGCAEALKSAKQDVAHALYATGADEADPWVHIVVERVPRRQRCIALTANVGETTIRDLSDGEVSAELRQTFGAEPKNWRWLGRPGREDRANLQASFSLSELGKQRVTGYRTLFAERLWIRTRTRRPKPTQCQKCHGYHRTEECRGTSRCATCGAKSHSTQEHEAAAAASGAGPKCINCRGPHAATDTHCPARPRANKDTGRLQRPGKAAMAEIRATQEGEWRTVQRGRRGRKATATPAAPLSPN
jgi:hypothetical protein